MDNLVTVRNTANGGVTKIKRSLAEHAVFGKHLEIVPDGTKPKVSIDRLVTKQAERAGKPKPEPKPKAPEATTLELEGDNE